MSADRVSGNCAAATANERVEGGIHMSRTGSVYQSQSVTEDRTDEGREKVLKRHGV